MDNKGKETRGFKHSRTRNPLNNAVNIRKGLPSGSVVKNLPANAGDMSLIPGPGRSHMPQSKKPCVP